MIPLFLVKPVVYQQPPRPNVGDITVQKTPLHQITMLSHRTDMDLSQSERHINVGSGLIMQEKIQNYKYLHNYFFFITDILP